jgi:hypothetical protein
MAYQATVNIRSLLDLDNCAAPIAVYDVLGDAYLCEHNTVYQNVRNRVLSDGYKLTTDTSDDLWRNYQVMSLSCLDEIIRRKTLPCFPTKTVIERLLDQGVLEQPLPVQFLLLALTPNNHFHESSHAVGYAALRSHRDLLDMLSNEEDEQKVWGSLLTEAVASTNEYIAWMLSRQHVERLFLRLNAPSRYEDSDLRTFARYVIEVAGLDFLFERVFLSFLAARLFSDFTTEARQNDLKSCGTLTTAVGTLDGLTALTLRTAKGLRSDYRDVVAPSYFALLGIRDAYDRILERTTQISQYGEALRIFSRTCFELSCLPTGG